MLNYEQIKELIKSIDSSSLRVFELESEGIVIRKVYPEIPVRIEYELTEKGQELRSVMDEIQKWAEKWT